MQGISRHWELEDTWSSPWIKVTEKHKNLKLTFKQDFKKSCYLIKHHTTCSEGRCEDLAG